MSVLLILAAGLVLFGLCASTDRMIAARRPQPVVNRDRRSYL